MRTATALLCLCLGASVALGQASPVTKPNTTPKPSQPAQSTTDIDDQQYAMQLLQMAESDAAGLQGGMRAYALMQLARVYQTSNKTKAVELLADALAATSGVDEDNRVRARSRLQSQIVSQLAPLAPKRVEETFYSLDPIAKTSALNALIAHYEGTKQTKRAVDLVFRTSHGGDFPYSASARLLNSLSEDSGDAVQLFSAALSSYRTKPQTQHPRESFTSFIRATWKRVPAALAKDAILEVLSQTEKQKTDRGMVMAFSSDKGATRFDSAYDFAIVQLLPILKKIDEDEANRLIKNNERLASTLQQFPDGLDMSPPPQQADRNAETQAEAGARRPPSAGESGVVAGMGQARMQMSIGGPMMGADMQAEVEEMRRASKMLAEAETEPEQAMANVNSLSKNTNKRQVLTGIARLTSKKKPSVARTALKQALDLVSNLEIPELQPGAIREIVTLYVQMEEKDEAQKAIERGLKIAETLYKTDSNSDNPNKALKAYWPSTEAYRSMIQLAARVSPVWALTLLRDIEDPEIKVAAETSLAMGWLKVPVIGGSTVMVARDNRMMMLETDAQ